jgi:signal transduction histidine kinase
MYKCKNGLVDVAMPIMVNNSHVGNFYTGQFFLEPPDIGFFKKQSEQFGFKEENYLKALHHVPIYASEKIKRIIYFLVQITEIIGNMGLQNYQNKENLLQLEADKNKLKEKNIEYSLLNKEYIAQNEELHKKEMQLELINSKLELLVELKTNELKETIDKLKESNSTKDRFFSIISHDLRSPIGQIINLSEMLEEQYHELSDERKFIFIRELKASSIRGYKLLENLLEWSRSQTGAIKFNPTFIPINNLITENIELLHMDARDKNIQLINHIDYQIKVWADENMLNTVFRNLISNAIKFTYPNGKVEISYRIQSKTIEIMIQDNGKGMTKEEQVQLFNIDSKFSTLGTNNEKGTGLGLIICREFIEKHKGEIWLESEKDKGSKFIISLPLT